MKRLAQIGEYTAIGASGDMSDWQQIQHLLDQLQVQEFNAGDEHALGPENIYEYLRY
jgi:20S proteasome subunit beta 7